MKCFMTTKKGWDLFVIREREMRLSLVSRLPYPMLSRTTVVHLFVFLVPFSQVLLFDFYSEVYIWMGNQSKPAMRRKAMELGKQMFDANCKHPVLNLRSSPARASGRYRPRSSIKSPRHSVVNASGRRTSRVSKSDLKPRPEWALFQR